MKKILSVLLAVMMLFGALSVSASAAYIATYNDAIDVMKDYTENSSHNNHFIIEYRLNDFSTKYAIRQYDSQTGFNWVEAATGTVYVIPENADQYYIGCSVALPEVNAPAGKQFNGWRCAANQVTYGAGSPMPITSDMLYADNYIIFEINWGNSAGEEDTLGSILGILSKVFGAIIGILFYNGDTAAGVALVEQMIGGLGI